MSIKKLIGSYLVIIIALFALKTINLPTLISSLLLVFVDFTLYRARYKNNPNRNQWAYLVFVLVSGTIIMWGI